MELLTIDNVWDGLGEVSGEDLTDKLCVVKCMKVDKKNIMIGMKHCPLDLRLRLAVQSAGVIDCIPALPAFTVVLGVEDERNILLGGEVELSQKKKHNIQRAGLSDIQNQDHAASLAFHSGFHEMLTR